MPAASALARGSCRSDPLASADMTSVLDRQKMSRLAFIRLLYQQADEQSRQPGLLAAASILAFHDAIELFLILACEHRASGPAARESSILQYWTVLRPRRGYDTGVELSSQHAVGRLTSVRNDLKHLGAMPSPEQLTDARSAAAAFFEDNTPRVFGIELTAIDMADIVPQADTRAKLKAAAAAEAAGDRREAMALLADGFNVLFYETVRPGIFSGPYGFGRTLRPDPMLKGSIGGMFQAIASLAGNKARGIQTIGKKLGDQFGALTEAVTEMQKAMRVIALGIDYARYLRFRQLTPQIYRSGDYKNIGAPVNYAPSRAEYDDCVLFVIGAALRFAELEASAAPPSWRSQVPP
jgi:hypothetical protein